VRTSYVPVYQAMADRAYHDGLAAYDRRHGWRGPIAHLASAAAAQSALKDIADSGAVPSWKLAAVTSVDNLGADIVLKDGTTGRIPLDELRWARRTMADQGLGPYVYRAPQVLAPGDIVYAEALGAGATAPPAGKRGSRPLYALRQVPDVSGGFMAMDPKTGRVFAMVGGWDPGDAPAGIGDQTVCLRDRA